MRHHPVASRVSSLFVLIFFGYCLCLDTKGQCGDECCNNYQRNKNGTCEECPFGTFGYQCTEECPENYYGRFCKNRCMCYTDQMCHKVIGCIYYKENGTITKTDSLLIGVSVSVIVVMIVGLVVCIIFLRQRACLKDCHLKFTVDNRITDQSQAEENTVHSRYLNLDCLNNEIPNAPLPVPDVITACPVQVHTESQVSSSRRDQKRTNTNLKSDSNSECQRLAIDSGEYVKMRSGQYSQDLNQKSNSSSNERSVYEDMSLIRSCKNKLSSFFRRRHNLRAEKGSNRFLTRYSVEMLEARNTFLPRNESELSKILERNCIEDKHCKESTLQSKEISGTSNCESSQNQSFNYAKVRKIVTSEKNEVQEPQFAPFDSMDAPYELCQVTSIPVVRDTDSETYSSIEIHSQTPRPSKHSNRSSYLGNGKVDEASYEKPWENNLPVHVQEYKEVAMELQDKTVSGEF